MRILFDRDKCVIRGWEPKIYSLFVRRDTGALVLGPEDLQVQIGLVTMAIFLKKLRVKDVIIMSLFAAMLMFPYFLMMHTSTAVIIQQAFANRLKNFIGTSVDGEEEPEGLLGEVEDLVSEYRTNRTAVEEEIPGLDEVLKKAAMPNNTIVMTALNSAWAQPESMIDLFLGSFKDGVGISHYLDYLLIVSLDQLSYDRCLEIHHHCFRLETEGVDFAAEKFFMSGDYLKMMWRRVEFLRIVLELGYDLLFSDADILWFRDPFPQFSPEADFQIACDHFNGNPTDISNLPNGGFVYVRSNERTIQFYKYWYENRLIHKNQHDQDVFNYIKHNREFRAFNLKIEFLETSYFGGFCEVSQDFSKVCTMHANCCTGLERKLFDLRLTVADWNKYKSMSPQEKKEQRIFWQAPRECLHSW